MALITFSPVNNEGERGLREVPLGPRWAPESVVNTPSAAQPICMTRLGPRVGSKSPENFFLEFLQCAEGHHISKERTMRHED